MAAHDGNDQRQNRWICRYSPNPQGSIRPGVGATGAIDVRAAPKATSWASRGSNVSWARLVTHQGPPSKRPVYSLLRKVSLYDPRNIDPQVCIATRWCHRSTGNRHGCDIKRSSSRPLDRQTTRQNVDLRFVRCRHAARSLCACVRRSKCYLCRPGAIFRRMGVPIWMGLRREFC